MKDDVMIGLDNLQNAIEKLKEGIIIAKSELEKDGVIQRFEFAFELLWKSAKLILENTGIKANSPKEVFKIMYKNGMIKDEKLLLEMLEDRNKMSHTYNKDLSEKIFLNIKAKYVLLFEQLLKNLKEKV
jgi:nucleotidyltransferase substrate binding protein (TIGR01987 family)